MHEIMLEQRQLAVQELEVQTVSAFVRNHRRMNNARNQDAGAAVDSKMWLHATRFAGAMFGNKQQFSRQNTSPKQLRWATASSEQRKSQVRSRCAAFTRCSDANAAAATPNFATRAAEHTRGMTPVHQVCAQRGVCDI